MNVFYPSGSNVETNTFEIKCCQPSNSQNIPRIVRYMPNRKLAPFSKTRNCGALLSKRLYKISHFQEHSNTMLFWVQIVYQISIIQIWLGGALLRIQLLKILHFQEQGIAALFWVNRFKCSSFSWSTTRHCGALLSTTTYHCGALSNKKLWIYE